jgi:uncharacterized protein (TIGR02266 family)
MTGSMTYIFAGIAFFSAILVVWVVWYFWKTGDRSDRDSLTSAKLRQNAGAERRQHPRIDINWPVSMETPEGTIDAQIKNISLGGAFIGCKKPLPIGHAFSLTMTGPDNEPITATAEVVWSNENVPEDKVVNRGIGVRFIKMSERHLQIVRQLFPKE